MKKVKVTVHEDKVLQYDLAMPDEYYNTLLNREEWDGFEDFLDDCVDAIHDPCVNTKELDYSIGVDSISDEKELLYLCY